MSDLNETGPRAVVENPTPPPALPDVAEAAFRQGNSVVSMLSAIHNSGTFAPVEGYSAWDKIKDDPELLPHAYRFGGMTSPAATDNLIDRIRSENADKRLLAQSGASGVVAGLAAGALDPTMFLPGRVALGVAKDGLPMIRAAAEVGGAMALQSTAQEALLHGSQETRDAQESVVNVGSATLLGAFLGSAMGALSRGERAALVAGMDHERATMEAHVAGEPPPVRPVPEEITPKATPASDILPPTAAEGIIPPGRLKSEPPPVSPWWRVQSAISDLAAEQGGISTVFIGDVIKKTGLPKDDVHDILKAARARGEAILSPITTTVANLSETQRAGVIPVELVPGDKYGASKDIYAVTLRRPREEAEIPTAGDAGAAATDERDLKLVSAGGLERFALDAKTRGMTSPLDAARRTTADLGEVPLLTEGNLRGETTAAQGLPVETDWKIATREFTTGVQKDITDNWEKHRFGDEKDPWFAAFRDKMNMLGRPADRLTQEEFANQVGWAMTQGDRHEIPEVAAAAQAIHKRMEPWGDRAEAAIEGYQKREGEPYYPHYWNKKLIREMRPEFVNFLTAKFAADQAEKAAIQGRVRTHVAALEAAEKDIKKLTAKLEKDPTDAATSTKLDAAHAQAAATRTKIEAEIGKWEGKSTKEAKAALKARDAYEAERAAKAAAAGKPKPTERLTQADSAVDKAVKRILESQKDREIEYLRQDAQNTTHHILGHPDGRLYAEGGAFEPGKRSDDLRGSEMARRLNVSNEEAWPWIEQNAEKASEQWARTFLPDTLLAEKFGDVEMRGPRQAILDEHDARSDATKDPKERLKLDEAKDIALNDIAFMRDKMRGTLNAPADRTDVAMMRAAGVARNVNVITSMGVSGLASLADTGTVMMRHGMLHTLGDAFMPYFRSLLSGGEFHGEALRQARAMQVAVDWQLANRHHQLAGVLDGYQPGSTAERALQWGADKMQLLNLLAPWTDFIKTMTMVVSAPDMKRAMEASLKGTATARQTRMLGEANIPAHMYERILNQYETHGGEIGGVWLPSLDKWTDEAAKRHFQGAQIREADISVVTPGIGDTPNWFSKPLLGMLGQFKSYTAASHTRILIANVQRRDSQVLSGLVGMMGVGMLSYKLNAITGGQPTSDRPQDWIKEAMSRSNMFGWFEESNAFASKLTRGQLDAYRLTGSDHMLSKYAGRSVVDQILGPTVGKLERISTVTGAAAARDWSAADTHALRQLVFFQNLFYVRGLLNEVEEGANNAFGVPQKSAR